MVLRLGLIVMAACLLVGFEANACTVGLWAKLKGAFAGIAEPEIPLVMKIPEVTRGRMYPAKDAELKEITKAKVAVFLGDGSENSTTHGVTFAKANPDVKVTKADVAIDEEFIQNPLFAKIVAGYELPNLSLRHIDHQKDFPKELEGKADMVVMNDGMCFHLHGPGQSCAGIHVRTPDGKPTSEPSLQFFRNVYGLLNKDNPKAKAFLGANHGRINNQQLQMYVDAGEALGKETGGKAKVRMVRNGSGVFLGVEITLE
jgi:hypothetical protein